jgi:Small Multidrug Resistance protein
MPFTVTPNLAWVLLLVAGLLEIVWSVSMKASQGFTKHHFTAITLVAAWLSFWRYLGWHCANCQSELPTRSGPALAQSVLQFWVSWSSASRSLLRASDASH